MSKFIWNVHNYSHRPPYNLTVIKKSIINDVHKNKIILDLGAGDGTLTKQLDRFTWKKIYAVEPNPIMFKQLKKLTFQNTVIRKKGLSHALPLSDASIDIIFIGTALHWFEPASTMQEFKRVLKPGGKIITFDNSTQSPWYSDIKKLPRHSVHIKDGINYGTRLSDLVSEYHVVTGMSTYLFNQNKFLSCISSYSWSLETNKEEYLNIFHKYKTNNVIEVNNKTTACIAML